MVLGLERAVAVGPHNFRQLKTINEQKGDQNDLKADQDHPCNRVGVDDLLGHGDEDCPDEQRAGCLDQGCVKNLASDFQIVRRRDDMPAFKLKGEMLELAEHIIKTKRGTFDPAKFDDRYETALAELVKAKLEGRKIEPRKQIKQDKVIDLMAALRESAGLGGKKAAAKPKAKAAPAGRKAS